MKNIILRLFFMLMTLSTVGQAQKHFKIHSHNDYLQNVPFWKALSAGASSVEADVFLGEDALYVAHTQREIDKGRNLENLYLEPLRKSLEIGLGPERYFQLLIDIKSEPYATLQALVETLKRYPSIVSNENISIVISGNRPKPNEYTDYPDYIRFDYQSLEAIEDSSILNKIALVSLSFKKFSEWNGKGRLTTGDFEKVQSVIEKAHELQKPFRFWATPDSKTAWKALAQMGVDYINTDMPFECAHYLNTLDFREYKNTIFSEVYRPTFESDGKNEKARNVILMIGDGNGLAQISATVLANNGELSLTQLKNIGFLKTQSADDFTTDSAAAGSALATGRKTPNRAIGTDMEGKTLENLTELLSEKGFVSGIVTTDEITGATPAAFYAHQKDRSMTEGIKSDLLKSKLSLFISHGGPEMGSKKFGDFTMLSSLQQVGASEKNKIRFLTFENPTADLNKTELATATENALRFLEKKNKPFFLMVEGAKIDSYGHENDIEGVIKESIGFDKAISKALKFADTDQNTLVIITADHETGGLTLPQGNVERNEIEGGFTTHDHTGIMVPVFAYGPSSNKFQGVYENTEIFHKLIKILETGDRP